MSAAMDMQSIGSIYYYILNECNFQILQLLPRPSIFFHHGAASKETKTASKCSTTNHEEAEGKRTKDGTRGKEIRKIVDFLYHVFFSFSFFFHSFGYIHFCDLQHSNVRQFGGMASSSNSRRSLGKRKPEEQVLKSSEGFFKHGVLDVKHLLRSASSRNSSGPSRNSDPFRNSDFGSEMAGKGRRKGGKKKNNKSKKKGGGKKRH